MLIILKARIIISRFNTHTNTLLLSYICYICSYGPTCRYCGKISWNVYSSSMKGNCLTYLNKKNNYTNIFPDEIHIFKKVNLSKCTFNFFKKFEILNIFRSFDYVQSFAILRSPLTIYMINHWNMLNSICPGWQGNI